MSPRVEAPTPTDERELVITRLIDAPPAKLYRAWTEPALLRQWFAPEPFVTAVAELDVRAGGQSRVVMRGPDGTEYPTTGVYLEVVQNQKLVFTDAFSEAWQPSGKPFMLAIVTLEEENGATRYTARVRHWTVEDRKTHEQMGFHEGWSQCADQLARLVARL